jgi:hypothetical protein
MVKSKIMLQALKMDAPHLNDIQGVISPEGDHSRVVRDSGMDVRRLTVLPPPSKSQSSGFHTGVSRM